MKFLGIFLMIIGFGWIGSEMVVQGIVLFGIGMFLFIKYKGKKNPKGNVPNVIKSTSTTNQKTEMCSFTVVGITKTNDIGKDIQKLINKYVSNEIGLIGYSYEEMTNNDILEEGEDIYEANIYGSYETTLELEPDNPYDHNAIKVIHSEIGHIGYVPAELTSKVKSFMLQNHHIDWELIGGKYKYVDQDEDTVKVETLSYGIKIELSY